MKLRSVFRRPDLVQGNLSFDGVTLVLRPPGWEAPVIDDPIEDPHCEHCGERVEDRHFFLQLTAYGRLVLHRRCVVGFATELLSELRDVMAEDGLSLRVE